MTDLLRGWPGASGAPSGHPASSRRLPAHVNPIPAPKSSRRAKYGGVGAADLEEQKRRRQPAPRVVRPKPLRGSQLFLHIIRTAESQQQQQQQQQEEVGSGLRQQGFGHGHSADEAGGDDKGPATTTQPAGRRRPSSTTAAAVDNGTEGVEAVASNGARAAAPAPGLSPAEMGSGGFRRRAKLFADSRDAPHPHTTARIVARLAACRDWRHPLSSRLLPTYLPLFDEHAAAYFFRHVPTLQPLGPSSLSSQLAAYELDAGLLLRRRQLQREQQRRQWAPGVAPDASRAPLVPASEERGFRLMVEAVCSSLLPKIPHFGPRALSYMAAGLGRMGIWYAPAVRAWDAASVGVLGTMRPDQLVSALEGRAQLAAAAAAEAQGGAVAVAATGGVLAAAEGPGAAAGGRGTPPHAWREAAVVAVGAALGDMRVDELARVMEALFTLGVQPPQALVEAACRRVVAALQEAAAAINTTAQPARAAPAAGSNDMNVSRPAPSRPPPVASLSAAPATTGTLLRLAGLEPAAGAASAPPAAGVDSTAAAQIASGTPVMSAAGATPSAPFALHPSIGNWQFSPTVQDRLGHAGRRVQPPGPDLGEHFAAFVCALGRSGTNTGPGHPVPAWWLDWLVTETAAVLEAQVGAMQRQRQAKQEVERVAQSARGRRAMRRALAAAAELQQQTLGASAQLVDAGSDTSQLPAAASATQRGKLSASKATPAAAATQPAPAQAPAAGVSSSAPGPFFSLEAMAALLQGAAGLWRARQADQRSPSAAGDVGDGHAPPRAWLNLALSAAVHDLQGRLSPAAAAAAADSARAAAPTAVITAGNVSLAEAAAIASAAGSAAAASRAAADAAQPTSVLLAALLGLGSSSTGSSLPQQAADGAAQLQSFATATELWRTLAGPDLGLRLVPHLSPAELQVWVQALAAWRGDSNGGGDGSNLSGGGGGPAARPSGQHSLLRTALPPDVDRWSAAVDVASRTRLDQFTGGQLCRLPVLAAAAGLRLPPGWAAAYVRNLTQRLVAPERSSDAEAPLQDAAAVCLREAAEALAAVRTAAPGAWPFLGAVAPDVVQALATTFGRVAASVGGASGLESGTVAGSAGEPAPDYQAGRRQRQSQGVPMQPDATRARVTALQLQAVVAALEEAIGGLQV